MLNEVRLIGDWEAWLDFFADAVIHTATQAVNTAQQLMKLSAEDGQRINGLKRIPGSAHLIHKAMLERPMASPKLDTGKNPTFSGHSDCLSAPTLTIGGRERERDLRSEAKPPLFLCGIHSDYE